MRITLNNKRIQLCILLCSLLFLECFYYGVFSQGLLGSSGVNDPAAVSSSLAGYHSGMSDRVNTDLGVPGAFNDPSRLNLVEAQNSRGQGFNHNYFLSAVLSALLLASLIGYLRIYPQIYNPFDSLQIAAFLHKEDGKK